MKGILNVLDHTYYYAHPSKEKCGNGTYIMPGMIGVVVVRSRR